MTVVKTKGIGYLKNVKIPSNMSIAWPPIQWEICQQWEENKDQTSYNFKPNITTTVQFPQERAHFSRFHGTNMDRMSPSILFSVGAKQLSKLSPPSHSCLCLSSISCSPSLILYRLYTFLYTSTSHTSATHFTVLTGGVFKRTSALFTADASTCPRFAFQSTSLGTTRSPLLRGRIHLRSKTSSESNIRLCFQSPIVQQQKAKLKARSGHCYRSHNALLHSLISLQTNFPRLLQWTFNTTRTSV